MHIGGIVEVPLDLTALLISNRLVLVRLCVIKQTINVLDATCLLIKFRMKFFGSYDFGRLHEAFELFRKEQAR